MVFEQRDEYEERLNKFDGHVSINHATVPDWSYLAELKKGLIGEVRQKNPPNRFIGYINDQYVEE